MEFIVNNQNIGKNCFYQYSNYILNNFLKKKVMRKIPTKYKYSILLIDSRKEPNLEFIIYNSIFLTDETVGFQIFCTKENYLFLKDIIKDIPNITINILTRPLKNINNYNTLITDYNFWEMVKGEYCLIIQPDTILIKHLNFNDYLFDFIGAPFHKKDYILYDYNRNTKNHIILKLDLPKINNNFKHNQNGGLSIRNINKMKEICKKYPYKNLKLIFNEYNEDTYFCYFLNKINSNLPSYEKSSSFSSEQVLNYNSIGLHKIWLYHKLDNLFTYLQKHYENIITNFK